MVSHQYVNGCVSSSWKDEKTLYCRFDKHIGPVTGLRKLRRKRAKCSDGADAATGCFDPLVMRPGAQILKAQC